MNNNNYNESSTTSEPRAADVDGSSLFDQFSKVMSECKFQAISNIDQRYRENVQWLGDIEGLDQR